jgi:hypothetical protein
MEQFEAGTGRTRVRLSWWRWGNDLYVHIGGGAAHVGAAALAGRTSEGESYARMLCIAPHKEGDLALAAAEKLHAATGGNVCVTAGVHVESITPAEIRDVTRNAELAAEHLAGELRARRT